MKTYESLEVAVTKNNVYLDQESQRQYDESRKFIEHNPQYEATDENNTKMVDWLELRNSKLTAESLQRAYECLFNGEPEPEVMTPKTFFSKVEPLIEPLSNNPITFGKLKGVDISEIAQTLGMMALIEEQKFLNSQAAQAAKVEQKAMKNIVAPMPTSWYSEIVELNTDRRIKDDV
jgi:hypothetical protein